MMQEEFISRLPENVTFRQPDWDTVEKVYMYHPSISAVNGKDQIARLYAEFGYRIIKDMLPTALAAQKIEEGTSRAKRDLEHWEREYSLLTTGEN